MKCCTVANPAPSPFIHSGGKGVKETVRFWDEPSWLCGRKSLENPLDLHPMNGHVSGGKGVPAGDIQRAEPRMSEAHRGLQIANGSDCCQQRITRLLILRDHG